MGGHASGAEAPLRCAQQMPGMNARPTFELNWRFRSRTRTMDKFLVTGGIPLKGTIHVSGAKNSALPCMAAAILTEGEVVLENIPQVRDIETERKLLSSMGAEVELGYGRAQHRTRIKCGILSDPVAKYEIVKTMRASSLVLGPLIARAG